MELCNAIDDNCDGAVDEGFDGDADGVTDMKAAMADHFLKIHDLEETAVTTLQHAMN